ILRSRPRLLSHSKGVTFQKLRCWPEWRNWHTQQTQNLPGPSPVGVQVPPPALDSKAVISLPASYFCWLPRGCCPFVARSHSTLSRRCASTIERLECVGP